MKVFLTTVALLCVVVTSYLLSNKNHSKQTLQTDTVINSIDYKVFYSRKFKGPVAVTYKVSQWGVGTCISSDYQIKNDLSNLVTATAADYNDPKYDASLMADPDNWSYNCIKMERANRFYNSVPQTNELKNGLWSHYNFNVGFRSTSDSVYVICYNVFGEKTIGNGVGVPDSCIKLAYSLTTGRMILSIGFTNTDKPQSFRPSIETVNKILKYTGDL
jgi:DNA/RNA endonuclease G (NUC1)